MEEARVLDILLVDDDQDLRVLLEELLVSAGHKVTTAADGALALAEIEPRHFDVVLTDVHMPRVDGTALLSKVRAGSPTTDVILMTGQGQIADAVAALKEGAHDYLTKPLEPAQLLAKLARIDEHKDLRTKLDRARADLLASDAGKTQLVGGSPAIRRVLDMVRMVAPSDSPVLVTGESGTGKELVARMIHERSPRADKPFVAVNCGALAESLIEAELFGHERGAFTGAIKKRDGRFKAAHGGTLFLDEIGELPAAAQAKILRVVQEGTFEPVGSDEPIKVDVRLISATHRNLRARTAEGTFREDLYYRINVIEIPLPPLRERPGDVPLLLRHFLARFLPAGAGSPTISAAALDAFNRYRFPGNVREFQHAVQHALVLSGGKSIDVANLPVSITENLGSRVPSLPAAEEAAVSLRPLAEGVRDFERGYLLRALEASGGKRTKAAEILGISRKTLWEKLKSHELQDPTDNDTDTGS
jgi:DNA-binding NtrC family response regulator